MRSWPVRVLLGCCMVGSCRCRIIGIEGASYRLYDAEARTPCTSRPTSETPDAAAAETTES
jgi:hypothetical protein